MNSITKGERCAVVRRLHDNPDSAIELARQYPGLLNWIASESGKYYELAMAFPDKAVELAHLSFRDEVMIQIARDLPESAAEIASTFLWLSAQIADLVPERLREIQEALRKEFFRPPYTRIMGNQVACINLRCLLAVVKICPDLEDELFHGLSPEDHREVYQVFQQLKGKEPRLAIRVLEHYGMIRSGDWD